MPEPSFAPYVPPGSAGAALADSPRERLLARLDDERTAAALEQLLDNAELLAFAVAALDGFLRRGDEVIEAVAESVGDLRGAAQGAARSASAVELAAALPRLRDIANRAMAHHTLEAITQLTDAAVPVVESGLLDPKLVRTLADAGRSLATAYEGARTARPEPLGALGLVRATRDPDVQRGLGFLVAVARDFGRALPRR